jgi:hypothetical protein
MKTRTNKRRIYRLFHGRFHSTAFTWRSAEEQKWLNIEPVGLEFGSPDYERLAKEQIEDWKLNALADARKGQSTIKVSLADL